MKDAAGFTNARTLRFRDLGVVANVMDEGVLQRRLPFSKYAKNFLDRNA